MNIKPIITSLFILTLISCLFGLAFYNGTWMSFAKFSLIGFALQIIIHGCTMAVVNFKYGKKIREIEADALKELTKTECDLMCPCAMRNIQRVPVVVNSENRYKCDKCGKGISAIVDITTALTTDPIDTEKSYDNLQNIKLPADTANE